MPTENNSTSLIKQTTNKLSDFKNILHTKIQKNIPKKIPNISGRVTQIKNIKKTYRLIQKLSTVNGFNPEKQLLHRTMFNSEILPPLGKEYWWFLFIGEDNKKPIQIMFLIFKKHGNKIVFNNKKMNFKDINDNKFQGVSSCWIWDGKKMNDLGDTNSTTTIDSENNTITTQISNHNVEFKGTYPNFNLKIGNIVNIKMTDLNQINSKDTYALFIPPFGIGWVDMFSKATGTVLGKTFKGTAHLQKVVGVMTSGCFNWGKIFFKNSSSITFFSVRIKKNSKIILHTSTTFYDSQTKTLTKFNDPKLNIIKIKTETENTQWKIHGFDNDNKFTIVLNIYGKKEFNMKTIEWQTYLEYLVTVKKFNIKTKNKTHSLNELGSGTGTFEDAFGFIF